MGTAASRGRHVMSLVPVLAMSATVPNGSPAMRSTVPSPLVVRATARSDDSGRSSRLCVDWSPVNRSRSASGDSTRRLLRVGLRRPFYLGGIVAAPASVL
jgi:hypothetical protein